MSEEELQAAYGGCTDVTTWRRLYADVYECVCCGTKQRLSQMRVQTHE